MTPTNWISLAAIIVGGIIALVVAHLHRQQMRQIELHRLDPEAPLMPPPHRVTRFIKSYWYVWWYLASGIYSALLLRRDLHKTTPIDRQEIFFIALDVGVLLLSIVILPAALMFHQATRLAYRTLGILEALADRLIRLEEQSKSVAKRR